jgi:hypothetical protein
LQVFVCFAISFVMWLVIFPCPFVGDLAISTKIWLGKIS